MYTLISGLNSLRASVRDEVKFPGEFGRGKRGNAAKRAQEWLSFHGYELLIDGVFGQVTEQMVRNFQRDKGIAETGRVNQVTFDRLIKPMMQVLEPAPSSTMSFAAAMMFHARKHHSVGPVELGGQNNGPWVRLYMDGNDGADQPWCAGFVRFILRQASETSGQVRPITGHVNCDRLGDQAKEKGFYVKGSDLNKSYLTPGSIFLSRASDGDLFHTGIVTQTGGNSFETIEGNTDEAGSANGYRVFNRTRGYGNYDFIIMTGHEAVGAQDPAHEISPFIARPPELAAEMPVDVRRYFYDDDIVTTYGSFYAYWDGWITAGHVIRDIKHTVPPFASGDVVYRPDGLDAALIGCTLPVAQPAQLTEGMEILVVGYPAGSAAPAYRKGAVHYTVPGSGKWIIRIDEPNEPVVSGMSGGVAIDIATQKPVGIIIEANHQAQLDQDTDLDQSLNIVSLRDVWNAVTQGVGLIS